MEVSAWLKQQLKYQFINFDFQKQELMDKLIVAENDKNCVQSEVS